MLDNRKNFYWTILGSIFYALSQWLILTILAKKNQIEYIGQYAIAIAITTPIATFLWLNLKALLATDKQNEFKINDYFNARLLLSILGLVLTIAIAILLKYNIEIKFLIVLIAISKCVEGLSDISYGQFQSEGKTYKMGLSFIFRGIIMIVLFYSLLHFFSNRLLPFIAIPFSTIIVFLVYDSRSELKNRFSFKMFNHHSIFRLVKLGLPLGLYILFYNLFTQVPRFLLEKQEGFKVVGIYTGIYVLVMTGVVFGNSLIDVIMPKLASDFSAKNFNQFYRLFFSVLALIIVVFIAGILFCYFFGSPLLSIIYSDSYSEFAYLLYPAIFLMILELITKLFFCVLVIFRKIKIQAYLYIFNVLVMIPLCYYCIGKFGVSGAFYSQALVTAIQLVIVATVIYFHLKKNFALYKIRPDNIE
ncbi:lipopolysaccharide biosynthesis protein [Flavobacterium sp.]|uniref:lipopolysaccharide biosynthesis protein n=1 Tax=Flavobacterium sp. TaxID=239 RepID=UPI003BD5D8DB